MNEDKLPLSDADEVVLHIGMTPVDLCTLENACHWAHGKKPPEKRLILNYFDSPPKNQLITNPLTRFILFGHGSSDLPTHMLSSSHQRVSVDTLVKYACQLIKKTRVGTAEHPFIIDLVSCESAENKDKKTHSLAANITETFFKKYKVTAHVVGRKNICVLTSTGEASVTRANRDRLAGPQTLFARLASWLFSVPVITDTMKYCSYSEGILFKCDDDGVTATQYTSPTIPLPATAVHAKLIKILITAWAKYILLKLKHTSNATKFSDIENRKVPFNRILEVSQTYHTAEETSKKIVTQIDEEISKLKCGIFGKKTCQAFDFNGVTIIKTGSAFSQTIDDAKEDILKIK